MIVTERFAALLKKRIAILELEVELKNELEDILGDSSEEDIGLEMKKPELIDLSKRIGELTFELEK